jgi:DNA-binding NtrC family response regulator
VLLLRFLETGELQKVGSERRDRHVDVRVIAATNRRLMEQIAAKEFREDLYYRLNVIHVVIPPLRERREDVAPLFAHFLEMFATQHQTALPTVSADTLTRLEAHSWPGNVRELKNLAERLIVRGTKGTIGCEDLPIEIVPRPSPPAAAPQESEAAQLFDRMIRGGESFWSAVYPAFMLRDLTRDDVREIVGRGLELAHGNYKIVVELFNMAPQDYKRFLNFLRKHNCHMPFQRFRCSAARNLREEGDSVAGGVAVGAHEGQGR